MLLEAVYHKPYSEYAFSLDENTLVIRIRAKKNELVRVLLFYYEKYNEQQKGSAPMEKVCCDELFDYFEVKLSIGFKRFKYMFYLESPYEYKWYSANGFFEHKPEWGFFSFSYILKGDIVESPDWFKNSIIYQILPDRFMNPLYPSDSSVRKKWDGTQSDGFTFFGGNMDGILMKIDYLKGLGINAIYLNPVFYAKSYHRYDTIDYYNIDPVLGDKKKIKELIDVCHKNNIRVILDGVFNHCSTDFFAFRDVWENGASSEYRDWFIIGSFPLKFHPKPNYEHFGTFGSLPKLNTSNQEVVKYLYDVALYWIEEFDIDGWRFDVADEVAHDFWRRLRERIKSGKKHSVLIGEIWDEASSWLGGDQFDSCLNYPLKSLINDLFAYHSISVERFRQKINTLLMNYKTGVIQQMVNLIGSHDTPRFLTLCGENKKKFELGVVFQFAFPGVPLIYYGDEVGMSGGGDPDCRKLMVWNQDRWDHDIQELYKFMIDLRKRWNVLVVGDYKDLEVKPDKDVLTFKRENEHACVIVMLNISEKRVNCHISLDQRLKGIPLFENLKTGETVDLQTPEKGIRLNAYEWKIVGVKY